VFHIASLNNDKLSELNLIKLSGAFQIKLRIFFAAAQCIFNNEFKLSILFYTLRRIYYILLFVDGARYIWEKIIRNSFNE